MLRVSEGLLQSATPPSCATTAMLLESYLAFGEKNHQHHDTVSSKLDNGNHTCINRTLGQILTHECIGLVSLPLIDKGLYFKVQTELLLASSRCIQICTAVLVLCTAKNMSVFCKTLT